MKLGEGRVTAPQALSSMQHVHHDCSAEALEGQGSGAFKAIKLTLISTRPLVA
jgi:hypothetical protein